VAVLDQVVLALPAARIAGEAVRLAQLGEALPAAGDELVHVGLVARIPDEGILGAVEDAVEGERELNHPQVRREVAAAPGDVLDQELTDLRGQLVELGRAQATQVGGRLDVSEHVGSSQRKT